MKLTQLSIFLMLVIFSRLPAQDLESLKDQTPVRLSSGLSLSTSFYRIQGAEHRQQPFNWFISGTPTLYIYGIAIPVSFYWSNQALSFQQPFNQIGITPTWRWIKLHAGYSSVHFSDYTMAGRRFLGGGVELNPGKLRFGLVYGRFQEAVEQDSILRPTPGSFLGEIPNGAFLRKGYSVKLGVGAERNFIDLILLQASDDSTSIKNPEAQYGLNPESNLAFGIKHRIHFSKSIFWESDMAISFYTRNLSVPVLDSIDSGIPGFVLETLEPRASSQLLYAGNTAVGYSGKNVKVGLRYRRISRDFKTMGAYYFQTDIQEYSANASAFLWKRKLNIRGTLGWQTDNLSGDRLRTTNRVIGTGMIGWNVTPSLRMDLVYSNFGIQQRNIIANLNDSLRIDQVSQSLQLQSRYQWSQQTRPQFVSLMLSFQELAPRTRDLIIQTDTRSYQVFAIYSYGIPIYKINISANTHLLTHTQAQGSTRSTGLGASVQHSTLKNALQMQLGARYYTNSFENQRSGNTWTFDFSGNIKITQTWTASLSIRHLQSLGAVNQQSALFNETIAQINTNFNF
jgi:hypothetical protein